MNLNEMIELVNDGYPDHLVSAQWDPENEVLPLAPQGDSLAYFIASELASTFDKDATDEMQINEAIRRMKVATGELVDLVTYLEDQQTKAIIGRKEREA
jgi:hypothetical protein